MTASGSPEELGLKAEALAMAAVDQAMQGLDLTAADAAIDAALASAERMAQGEQTSLSDAQSTPSASEWAALVLAAQSYREASARLRGAVREISGLAASSQHPTVQSQLEQRMKASGLKQCPQCGNFVRGEANGCPFCGHHFVQDR